MRKIILSLLPALMLFGAMNAQNMNFNTNTYEKEWKEITALEEQGLPKSALEKVLALYVRAKADNNPSQMVKTLLHRGKYTTQLEEDGFVKAIAELRDEADKADFPTKPVLQSILADLYANYLENNRWQFHNRTTVLDFKDADIRTWDLKKLADEAATFYRASLADNRTQQVPIKQFDAVTTEGSDELRPTLYDFLAHRAIDYFMDEKSYLTQPAYKFELDDDAHFADAVAFVALDLAKNVSDTASHKLWTLRLLQDVMRFHLKDAKPEALLDVDLKRLDFVKNNSVVDTKEELYLKNLENLSKRYAESPSMVEIALRMAQYYRSKAQNWRPDGTNRYRDDNKKALEIARAAVKKFPKAYGVVACRRLINDIIEPYVDLKTESVNVPNRSILASMSFRNVDSVYLKVVRLAARATERSFRDEVERLKFYNALPIVKSWVMKVPNTGDYNLHITEFKMDKLGAGNYAVMVADNAKFTFKGSGNVSALSFQVSNLAVWHRQANFGKGSFVVMNRTTGEPIAGAKVDFFENRYNPTRRVNERIKLGQQMSDKNGFVVPDLPKDRYYTLVISKDKDTLLLDQGFTSYVANDTRTTTRETFFFLDRTLYRPGQTVYFKALVVEKSPEGKPQILRGTPVEITFLDANYQRVSTLKLTTNDYGTVNGSFVAPSNGMTGRMILQSNSNGQAEFRVEEYKRPKFEVKIEPLEGSFVLNQSIAVKGNAKAFAGSNVDGAKVKYRVVREVRFPYWFDWYWNPWRTDNAQEIAHGETMTDAKGNFTVNFKALPDRRIPKDNKPVFEYRVFADVTDVNGETHSANGLVSVGYIATSVTVDVEDAYDKKDKSPFSVKVTNLNGQPLSTEGTIVIEQLNTPKRIFSARRWELPDTNVMKEADFRKEFPNYAWGKEDKIEAWKPASVTYSRKVLALKEGVTRDTLDFKNWASGDYRVTATMKDSATGEMITVVKHFKLYSRDDKKVPFNVPLVARLDKTSYEPGETANLQLGAFDKTMVLIEEEINGKMARRTWKSIGNFETWSLPIEEAHRGNVYIHLSYTYQNASAATTQTIVVPYSNKELTIEYQTFRDKLLPGQAEEWRLKISGKNKEKVAAEMVAALYDASLDKLFRTNDWYVNLFPMNYGQTNYTTYTFGYTQSQPFYNYNESDPIGEEKQRLYRQLNNFGFGFGYGGYYSGQLNEVVMMDAAPRTHRVMSRAAKSAPAERSVALAEPPPPAGQAVMKASPNTIWEDSATAQGEKQDGETDFSGVASRTNLKETVFFFPTLMTDEEGNVIVKFTMNEALTRWKFLALAHTKELQVGLSAKEVVTQKDLMVFPNAPRYFREGDQFVFSAKISNLTADVLRGQAKLELFDALTMKPIDDVLENKNAVVNFEAKGGESTPVNWSLRIPVGKVQAVTYRVVAKAGNFSDGEENTLPVLTNRLLVTETLPLSVRGGETKKFSFESLKNAGQSTTLTNHRLTLEFTQNPAWYAVQALPYLMEYPYECTEQIFSRFYANALASNVANSYPKVKAVFDRWRDVDVSALTSNLSKNQELKTALLEETPWVLAAQREELQKKNIALLFDLNKMANESEIAIKKMRERQLSNGGFAWFPGGNDNWFITQYITEGFGHLNALGVKSLKDNAQTAQMIARAVQYCDERAVEHYQELEKEAAKNMAFKLEEYVPSGLIVHYLYMRSFFDTKPADEKVFKFFLNQAEKFWLKQGLFEQGLVALACKRNGKGETTAKIVKSLKERALNNPELGMYWKSDYGFYWNQMPIETQSLMIELFNEVNDAKAVDDLKVWLLKNKQTTNWKTTKATASVVYALLKTGDNWLVDDKDVQIQIGGKALDMTTVQKEAGTGYFKTEFPKESISPKMADVQVSNPNKVVSWGALYWQYFENLDKIKDFRATPLTLKKQLFKEVATDKGLVLTPISENAPLSIGDKIKVRIELRVDRDMEYVHMKDMRAAGFEPVNVLSQYKWQGGLGYYESTRDAATNFFFDYLRKGTYVFEYPLVVNQKGDFSNGITTIQCMYAPEFTSHSEGIRVKVN